MIYILEDDDNIRELVVYTLNQSGFEATGFALPSEMFKALAKQRCQLLLLDIMLPEKDGITVLKEIRAGKETENIPVVMLTAKGSEYDKVIGLDSGADDYITKPFGMMELVSRVKAVLRRTKPKNNTEMIQIDDLTIIPKSHIVKVKDQEVALTMKEYELLLLLSRHPGQVFSRDDLLEKIWGYAFDKENRTVDVHIRTLRVKLKECGSYIETVRGVGYKLEVKDE
ncbi:MAG TPA: response regulator transcription factor [Candidatus Fimiplasma intestinipullorum]|uniref:Stage 0 sporulation protein A homolog n=1 Tax=Candidatus Fimiplasma intestinipullorum TaxID=2840825 RepID=A0A9D1HND9_9FIRM|nr:response regulator transcription factor [Candidatus Fimiplasma intestinipullorum]